MTANTVRPFRPLVVGTPRSGFALLASVVIHFLPLAPRSFMLRQRVLRLWIDRLGTHTSRAVVRPFERQGIARNLLYNRISA